jgi:DNA anti-recombination protein RmuC
MRHALQTTGYGAIMDAMTKSWTDERLEERFDRIDDRFDGMDRRFDEVDQRFEVVDRRFETVDRRFDRVEGDFRELRAEMKVGFERIDDRFEALHLLLLRLGGVVIAALIGLIATQL